MLASIARRTGAPCWISLGRYFRRSMRLVMFPSSTPAAAVTSWAVKVVAVFRVELSRSAEDMGSDLVESFAFGSVESGPGGAVVVKSSEYRDRGNLALVPPVNVLAL